ncbi:MAG: response regulator [Coriobacteriales bacterium]|jgi:signal transduction histidine kinase|nr:response regulator [Coriobacteriales bacterium]
MKKALAITGLLAITAVTTSLLVAFIIAQTSLSPAFYVNLRDYPIYLKTGFDLSTVDAPIAEAGASGEQGTPQDTASGEQDTASGAQTPQEAPNGWQKVITPQDTLLPDASTICSDNPLPASFADIFQENDREYTIAIPFEMDEMQMAVLGETPPIIPGIYLAGIGDNWQIFFNGALVDSHLNIDESGTILTHNTRRNYGFELDPTLFRLGENLLTIRIIGTAHGGYTGLFYQSPYYIASYEYIITQTADYLTLIFCTVYILMGLYHLLLFSLRLNDRYNFCFGLFSIFSGIYFMTRSSVIHMLIADWNIIQRLEYTSLFVLPFLLTAFLELIDIGKTRWPTRIYGLFCLLTIIAEYVVSLQFLDDILSYWQISLVLLIVYLVGYDLLFRFFWRARVSWKQARESRRPQRYLSIVRRDLVRTPLGNFSLVLLFVVMTAVYDLLDATMFHTGIAVTRYSFFAFTILSAIVLARHFTLSFNRADDLNVRLEKIVRERTHELAEQVRVAQQASRAKSQFLATMSHEIRTPLNAIIGLSDIELEKDLPQQTHQSINQIRSSGTTLLGIINDILDISKIEAGSFDIVPVDYHLASVINDVTQINVIRIGDKPIRLILEIDSDLPTSLHGDELRFKQILNNVLSNGIKYTNEGEVRMVIKSLRSPDGKLAHIHIAISDTGIGIKPADIERLFDEYSQLDAQANRKVEGTGLGLSITRQLLAMMGGSIQAQSTYGKGSIFTIELPQAIVDPTPLGEEHARRLSELRFDVEEQSPANKLERSWLPHGRVLVVDDVAVNIAVAEGLLEPYGIEVDSAFCGQEAVDKVRAVAELVPKGGEGSLEGSGGGGAGSGADGADASDGTSTNPKPYDIIFMDHMMPGMDGIEATQRIRALDSAYARSVPIVALTANALTGNEEMFLNNGFTGFISKPIDIELLDETVNRWIH